ncbi:hypothetical protein BDF19DRAFT_440680 [Syncephalis fuscata]|nr:hypothetical protein BDF19DRAFT_440680 [Syncephalis fuscata]
MQDEEGKPLENAHLLGFFRRICKLLHHNIKPVFVFDGATPELKRRTIAHRKRRQLDAEENLQRTAKQLLTAQMKMRALQAVQSDKPENSAPQIDTARKRKRDEYDLPPIDLLVGSMIKQNDPRFVNTNEDGAIDDAEEMRDFIDRFDTEALDFDSEAFKSLPLEIRYELLQDAKIHSRQTSWQRLRKMTANATNAFDFSQQQIKLLMRRNDLTQKYMDLVGQNMGAVSISANIASNRNRSYVLVKNEDGRSGWSMQLQGSAPVVTEPNTDDTDDAIASSSLDDKIKEVEDEMVDRLLANSVKEETDVDEPIDLFEDYIQDDEMGYVSSDDEQKIEIKQDRPVAIEPSEQNRSNVKTDMNASDDEDDEGFEEVPIITNETDLLKNNDESSNERQSPAQVLRYWLARVDGNVSRLFPDYFSCLQSDADEMKSVAMLKEKLATERQRVKDQSEIDSTVDSEDARQFYARFLADLIKAKSQQTSQVYTNSTDTVMHHKQPILNVTHDLSSLDLSTSFLSARPLVGQLDKPTELITPANEVSGSTAMYKQPVLKEDDIMDVSITDLEEQQDNMPMSKNPMPKIDHPTSIVLTDKSIVNLPESNPFIRAISPQPTNDTHEEAQAQKSNAQFVKQLQEQGAKTVQQDLAREVTQLYQQRRKEHRELNQVSNSMIQETMELLQLFGIPYIVAPTEAEAQCATLVHLSLVDGVITDDSDIFLFDGTPVYRYVFQPHRHVECYLAADMERELFLTRDRLIQLAYLLGSDYTSGVAGIGRVTAMEVISEWQGPQGLAAFREWITDADEGKHSSSEVETENATRRRLRKICHKIILDADFPDPRVADAYLHPTVDDTSGLFQWELPDLDGIRWYLMKKIGWEQEKVDERLLPIIRRLNEFKVNGMGY